MFIKTVLAILITTVFAGAAVYYGSHGFSDVDAEIKLDKPQQSKILSPQGGVFQKQTITKSKRKTQEEAADIIVATMQQAEKIKTSEIKDQAYLDVVDYAVRHKFYKVADEAMQKIGQVELRDTARSQIAIAMAKAGRSDDAFMVIDQVEIPTLRDVMRLQVIEAIMSIERQAP